MSINFNDPLPFIKFPYFVWWPTGQQYEDLKKAKEDIVDECAREKSAHKAYKKECSALKAEYNIIRLKVQRILVVLYIKGGHFFHSQVSKLRSISIFLYEDKRLSQQT